MIHKVFFLLALSVLPKTFASTDEQQEPLPLNKILIQAFSMEEDTSPPLVFLSQFAPKISESEAVEFAGIVANSLKTGSFCGVYFSPSHTPHDVLDCIEAVASFATQEPLETFITSLLDIEKESDEYIHTLTLCGLSLAHSHSETLHLWYHIAKLLDKNQRIRGFSIEHLYALSDPADTEFSASLDFLEIFNLLYTSQFHLSPTFRTDQVGISGYLWDMSWRTFNIPAADQLYQGTLPQVSLVHAYDQEFPTTINTLAFMFQGRILSLQPITHEDGKNLLYRTHYLRNQVGIYNPTVDIKIKTHEQINIDGDTQQNIHDGVASPDNTLIITLPHNTVSGLRVIVKGARTDNQDSDITHIFIPSTTKEMDQFSQFFRKFFNYSELSLLEVTLAISQMLHLTQAGDTLHPLDLLKDFITGRELLTS